MSEHLDSSHPKKIAHDSRVDSKCDVLMALEDLKEESLHALIILINNLMADVNKPSTDSKSRKNSIRIPFFDQTSKTKNQPPIAPAAGSPPPEGANPPALRRVMTKQDSTTSTGSGVPLPPRGRRMSLNFGLSMNGGRMSQTAVAPGSTSPSTTPAAVPSGDMLAPHSRNKTSDSRSSKSEAESQMSVDVLASESLLKVASQLRQSEKGRAAADIIEHASLQQRRKSLPRAGFALPPKKSGANRYSPTPVPVHPGPGVAPSGPSVRRRASIALVLTVPPEKKTELPTPVSVPHRPSSPGSNLAAFQRTLTTRNGEQLSQDHLLALMLAGVCNSIYQFLESEPAVLPEPKTTSPLSMSLPMNHTYFDRSNRKSTADTANLSHISSRLQNVMSTSSQLDYNKFSESQTELWNDIQSFLELLKSLVASRLAKGEGLLERSAGDAKLTVGHAKSPSLELENVMQAMDRITARAPRLSGQDFNLTEEQARMLATVRLGDLIERLNRKGEKFEAQRASPDTKYHNLNVLVDQIVQSAQRRLDTQRVELTNDQIKRIDWSQVEKALDRSDQLRLRNQDWVSKDDLFADEIMALQAKMESSFNASGSGQRYVLSDDKERDLELSKILGQLEKLADSRLESQAAKTKEQIQEEKFDELLEILDKLPPPLMDQSVDARASTSA